MTPIRSALLTAKRRRHYDDGGTIPFGPEAAQRAVQIAKQQAGRR